jgi:hypothetical protein
MPLIYRIQFSIVFDTADFKEIFVAAPAVCHTQLLFINGVATDTVEGDATRGTTTLVYLQLHISLYTGTVHVLSRVAGIRPLV